MRALSIRQPYAEQILLGLKTVEYRNRPTHVRRRVYIYAALKPGDPDGFTALGKEPGDLATGVIVGSVKIVDCTGSPGNYRWHLARPRRMQPHRKRLLHPQPSFFYPFPARR